MPMFMLGTGVASAIETEKKKLEEMQLETRPSLPPKASSTNTIPAIPSIEAQVLAESSAISAALPKAPFDKLPSMSPDILSREAVSREAVVDLAHVLPQPPQPKPPTFKKQIEGQAEKGAFEKVDAVDVAW